MDLTKVLTRDVWSDVLANLNIFKDIVPILNSHSVIQETLLDNIQHKRYKQPAGIVHKEIIEADPDDPDDFDQEQITEFWRLDGEFHNENKPAFAVTINGVKYREKWYLYGQIHSDKGPAITLWNTLTGKRKKEEWYQYDKIHNENGPAYIEYNREGRKIIEKWIQNGIITRDPGDGPAITKWDDNGNIITKEYVINGKLRLFNQNSSLSLPPLPAKITYYRGTDQVSEEKYFIDGQLIRRVSYYRNGKKKEEQWTKITNKIHRVDGPAFIQYKEDGSKKSEDWYFNGVRHRGLDQGLLSDPSTGLKGSKITQSSLLPATTIWYDQPTTIVEYLDDGTVQKRKGPSIIKEYWVHGRKIDR